jgi:hypothetical protein
MYALAAATLLALTAPAHAEGDEGTLQIGRKGGGAAFVFIDGEQVGKVTGKKGFNARLSAGRHVVWISPDKDAFRAFCAGTIDIRPGTFSKVVLGPKNRCKGLKGGAKEAAPARGARIKVTGDKGYVQVDGRDAGWTGFARFVNVAPGSHAVRITDDLLGKETRCKGKVQVAKAEVAVISVGEDGACTGFGEDAE